MTHEFRPQAALELSEATRWYLIEGGGPAIAEQFAWAVQRALRLLGFMPQLGSPAHAGTRAWPLKRCPYTRIYRAEASRIVVIAVAHQSREPGYWQGR